MCVYQGITHHLCTAGLGPRHLGPGASLGSRKEMVHLVENQTGGKQVLWPVPDAEFKAESPGGLRASLSLKTTEEAWWADLG